MGHRIVGQLDLQERIIIAFNNSSINMLPRRVSLHVLLKCSNNVHTHVLLVFGKSTRNATQFFISFLFSLCFGRTRSKQLCLILFFCFSALLTLLALFTLTKSLIPRM